jgi:uncharacterized membrane protein
VTQSDGELERRQAEAPLPAPDADAPETVPVHEALPVQESLPGMGGAVLSAEYRHSGPLPDPRTLQMYDAVMPGLGERIVTMAEDEARHRRDLERKVVGSDVDRARDGQRMAFALAVFFLGASVWLALAGHPVPGTIIGTVDIVALVTVFIVGRREDNPPPEQEAPPPEELPPGQA